MDNTWRLIKREANTIYTQEHLTVDDVLAEMFYMLSCAHHGCLIGFTKTCCGLRSFSNNVDSYIFEFEFSGDKVIYIFEREVQEDA